MSDLNGNALSALAAALAPYLVAELAKVGGAAGGNPVTQAGGGFGAQQAATGFAGFAGQPQSQSPGAQGNVQQPAQTGMFGAQQAAQAVTPDMIQQLIVPLVQNEQVKNALTAQMQQMGIQNLPDARPEQLAELYSRFQEVDKQARAAGLIGGQQAAGAPSII